jgi:hypothetical protein
MGVTLTLSNCLPLALLVALPTVAGCQLLPSQGRPSAPDPKNELPQGFIDAPATGAGVGRAVQMYGWALDDGGVAEVRVYVDGRFAVRAPIDQKRPDVSKAYPDYAANTDVHGWAVTVPLDASLSAGPHTIIAQAVDTQGATRDIGTITVSVTE